jgi:spermidine synthase
MSAIQSRMHLQRPDALELEYTRMVMGWLMLRPAAQSLAMIGLGGGSIAKFCHRHLPRTTMLVVEIDPRVIALREAFHVPPDDARFRVVEGDGAQFIATTEQRFDVLIVDAFDAEGMPAAFGTQRFYDDCLDVLTADGLFVVNLHTGHAAHAAYVERIARSFGQRILRVTDLDGSNSVVFAAKGGELSHGVGGAVRKPAALADAPWQQLRGAFSRIASALQRDGASDRADDQAKVIAPSSSRP